MGDSRLGSDAPARPNGIRHGPSMDFALDALQALINAQGMATAYSVASENIVRDWTHVRTKTRTLAAAADRAIARAATTASITSLRSNFSPSTRWQKGSVALPPAMCYDLGLSWSAG